MLANEICTIREIKFDKYNYNRDIVVRNQFTFLDYISDFFCKTVQLRNTKS